MSALTQKQTIKEILQSSNYNQDQALAAAKIYATTGALDEGKVNKYSPKKLTQEAQKILGTETSLEEFQGKLQQNLFKKYRGVGERQQIENNNELDPIREQLNELFEQAGLTGEIKPSKENYDVALVFGATEKGMRGRLDSFLKLKQEEDIENIGSLYVLAGARDLWLDSPSDACCAKLVSEKINENRPEIEQISTKEVENIGKEIFKKAVAAGKKTGGARVDVVNYFKENHDIQWPTEADAALELIQEDKYKDLSSFLTIINAPKKPDGKRPDTFDTVKAFKDCFNKNDPLRLKKEVSVISVSNQPYIKAQNETLSILPDNFKYETVGAGVAQKKSKYNSLLSNNMAGALVAAGGAIALAGKKTFGSLVTIGALAANYMGAKTKIESPKAEHILPDIAGQFYKKSQVTRFLEKEALLQQSIAV